MPAGLQNAFYADPLGIPILLWVAFVVMFLWAYLRSTQFGPYLYASGGGTSRPSRAGCPCPQ